MKSYKNLEELNKEWIPHGLRVNEKGEIIIIGERDGKEYKIGQVHQRIVSEKELTKFTKKASISKRKREREREKVKKSTNLNLVK